MNGNGSTNFHKSQSHNLKTVPSNLPEYTSQIQAEEKSFIWKIKGAKDVRLKNLWNVANCDFKASGCNWRISLNKTEDDKYLNALVKLIEPTNSTVHYHVKFNVVNHQGFVIHSGPLKSLRPVAAESGQSLEKLNKWEVLKFCETLVDGFDNLLHNDTLSFLIEMTVFRNII